MAQHCCHHLQLNDHLCGNFCQFSMEKDFTEIEHNCLAEKMIFITFVASWNNSFSWLFWVSSVDDFIFLLNLVLPVVDYEYASSLNTQSKPKLIGN